MDKIPKKKLHIKITPMLSIQPVYKMTFCWKIALHEN